MYIDRVPVYSQLEALRESKVLVYITSDRRGLESQIANDILSTFTNHLDAIGDVQRISLILYTRGGNTLTAWTLVNLIRNFCKDFEVIIPFNCHSAGTLIALGANRIIMTKQATMGPIDPSVNGPLNPQVPGGPPNAKVPVSVEFVNAYLELVKNELRIGDEEHLSKVLIHLAEKIHPLTLGQVFKSKSQIQMLAKRLLKYQQLGEDKENEIIKFLCSESGSHDYTIHRNEARDVLGLKIEKPDDTLYAVIKSIYIDIEKELELNNPYDPSVLLANTDHLSYSFRRGLIESIDYGCNAFVSEGLLTKQVQPPPPGQPPTAQKTFIQDARQFEGWRFEQNAQKP